MIPDPEIWYQAEASGAWYRRAEALPRKDVHYIRICERCDHGFLGKKKARFCCRTCSSRSRVQQPSEIPDWIDTATWRPGSQGTWYKQDSKHAHVIKVCERCGGDYLGLRHAQFCSNVCAGGGDGQSYGYAHQVVRREKGAASGYACADCGAQANEWSYDGLDPGELVEPGPAAKRYSFDPDRYQPRCHGCHAIFDRHFGEGNPNAKLTDAQHREIQLTTGVTQKVLAERFGVTQGHISRIKRGLPSGTAARREADKHAASETPEDHRELEETLNA